MKLSFVVAGALLAASGLSAVGCSTTSCTAELAYALSVTVLNPAGKQVCNATVTAQDGVYKARLQAAAAPPCPYAGAPERAGVYSVSAVLGHRTGTASNVVVTADRCHVRTQAVTVKLH